MRFGVIIVTRINCAIWGCKKTEWQGTYCVDNFIYQYTRLPFGVKTATGIFQNIINSMISGLKDKTAYLDDVIIFIQTEKELRERFECLLEPNTGYGWIFNGRKRSVSNPQNIMDSILTGKAAILIQNEFELLWTCSLRPISKLFVYSCHKLIN